MRATGTGTGKALVVINPVAGGGRARRVWARAWAGLDGLSAGLECVTTERPRHALELARDAAGRGFDRVVAVGGDGTVSEVAAGLAGTGVALGVVPGGTGNDFSRTIRVPAEPSTAARLALAGPARWVDLGEVQTRQRCVAFVNVAGCGFDAEIIRRVPPSPVGRLGGGTLPYVAGVLRTLWTFRPRVIRLVVDGRPLERRVLVVAVANGRRYGGGMLIAPGASVDDGLFDVCLIGDLSPLEVLALLPRMYTGGHRCHPLVEFFRCRELRAQPASATGLSCQADGELIGELPVVFTIQAGGLRCVTGPLP